MLKYIQPRRSILRNTQIDKGLNIIDDAFEGEIVELRIERRSSNGNIAPAAKEEEDLKEAANPSIPP